MAGGAAAMPRSSEGRVDCTMRLLATALLHTSKGYALGRRSWLFTCDGAVIFGEPICVAGSRDRRSFDMALFQALVRAGRARARLVSTAIPLHATSAEHPAVAFRAFVVAETDRRS